MTDTTQHAAREADAARGYPLVVHILFVGIFIVGWAEMSIVGILPDIAASYGVSSTDLGVVISLYSLSFAIVGPAVLVLVRGLSPRVMLASLMAVIAVTSLASAMTDDVVAMSSWRMALAAASAAFAGTTMSVAVRLVPPQNRGRVLGYIAAGFGGSLVGGVPLTILISDFGGWRLSMELIAAAAVLVTLALWFAWPAAARAKAEHAPMRTAAIRALPASHMIAQASMFLWMLAYAVPFTFLPSILRESLGYSAVELTIAMVLFGCCCVAGAQLGGMVSDRLGELRTITLAFSAHAAILLAAPFLTQSFPGVLLTMAAWGLASWMSTPPLQAQIAKTSGDISDLMLTLSNSVLHAGIAVGAGLGALLMAQSMSAFFHVPVAILAVAIVLLWRHQRSHAALAEAGAAVNRFDRG
ncbi:MFS transporter [Salinarimonas sp.]|uniref:MFS transporter n=1 Tax=Salinarimonas sp. TaxID=2766526 RepID=UPI0032D9AAEB